MSQGKMLLLATISVLGALPIFLLVASGARLSLGTARRRALRGLQEWVGKTRWRVRRWITLTAARTRL